MTYSIKPISDTWLKQTTGQGAALSDAQKQWVKAGVALPIIAFEPVEGNHLKITLGRDAQGQQVQFKGRNTWYVYQPAVQVLRDNQVLPPGAKPIAPSAGPASSLPTPKTINAKGLRLLKSFEGLVLNAYVDAVGVWTIGYGTTKGVKPGMKITEAEAEAFLKRDLTGFEAAVTDLVTVALNEDQFSALVCFTYNVGDNAFADSTLLRVLNQGHYSEAADQLLRWNKGNGRELPGLTRRRKAERALFLGQDYTVFL